MATTKKATTAKATTAKRTTRQPKATTTTRQPKATTPPKTRRVFPEGQCHHRDAKGRPDCSEQIVAKRANLCPAHEKVWQAAARVRYAANRAAKSGQKATTTRRGKAAVADQPAATDPAELEAALAASNAAFATPELAAKARAKRAAAKAS